jgi:hypothetical protein
LEVVSGDVATLVSDPQMKQAVQLAVATKVGVGLDLVEVTLSEGSSSRRLRGAVGGVLTDGSASRRLAGQVLATYVITFPADAQGLSNANAAADVFSATTEEQLTSSLQSAMASVSDTLGDTFTLVVQAFDAPSLVTVQVSPTSTTSVQQGEASWALPQAAPIGLVARLAVTVVVLAASSALA